MAFQKKISLVFIVSSIFGFTAPPLEATVRKEAKKFWRNVTNWVTQEDGKKDEQRTSQVQAPQPKQQPQRRAQSQRSQPQTRSTQMQQKPVVEPLVEDTSLTGMSNRVAMLTALKTLERLENGRSFEKEKALLLAIRNKLQGMGAKLVNLSATGEYEQDLIDIIALIDQLLIMDWGA